MHVQLLTTDEVINAGEETGSTIAFELPSTTNITSSNIYTLASGLDYVINPGDTIFFSGISIPSLQYAHVKFASCFGKPISIAINTNVYDLVGFVMTASKYANFVSGQCNYSSGTETGIGCELYAGPVVTTRHTDSLRIDIPLLVTLS